MKRLALTDCWVSNHYNLYCSGSIKNAAWMGVFPKKTERKMLDDMNLLQEEGAVFKINGITKIFVVCGLSS